MLERKGDEAGSVKVRVVCVKDAEGRGGRVDLATAGANARRATEDSSAVALIEEPGRANRFTRPILDEAQIGVIAGSSGEQAMTTVLDALESGSGSEPPREAVREGL